MMRIVVLLFLAVLFTGFVVTAILAGTSGEWVWWILVVLTGLLVLLGIRDLLQKKHAILRNFPIVGHARYLFEFIRPEIQQYFIERNTDGRPFNRDTRSLIYARAKGADSHKAFGTELNVNEVGHEYLLHSAAPVAPVASQHRVRVGSSQCSQPYEISLMNISSMSFGSLSANAVLAMNKGAAMGEFVHETGEGGLTKYHLEYGADLFWEIGSGYFGCRTEQGRFNPETFAAKANHERVKGITIKLSQGAKPGLGGVLPAAKVTAEISEARDVPMGVDCISPASHAEFSTPRELMHFVAKLRDLSGGKPVGIKFCVGSRTDVMALCKGMLETGILVDFITIDGAEGGTGAAPLEYEDHVGAPLTEGLMLVHNTLVGAGLRDEIRLAAAGKVANGSDIIKRLIQGADFTFSARSMMMATGCIQAQQCHTNHCPVGVATQNKRLMRALDVEDKGHRVYNYHRLTVTECAQIMASMGLTSPEQLNTRMLRRRVNLQSTRSYASLFQWLRPGELLEDIPGSWMEDWDEADADHFGEHAPLAYTAPKSVDITPSVVREPADAVNAPRIEPRDSAKVRPVHADVTRPEGKPGADS
ncbi:glutamate synthase domain-containing protein 2 [Arthrobacter sp. JUb119]|uniref:FMN-binding glutamate synthase family protein n=1 Tax=Micrococcaceae TaxID=1268 RepID=UPI000CFDF612|nr:MULTISPECIES: FMN-binding glutamate synthase family protein [unclassified Arthrobacter]MCS3492835.1 glutamate synthase domain-containing protein 2 [Arthrobacter sp. JUb119]PQZ84984.1 FMN-binding glutamate synthase family protein [Arthrobacter sp. MYb222]PRB73366.1 FMN-binding glutamate synthase family protein [Arthrobacter sp. MYb214]TDU20579.1 glutamate synthase domain-containing protein 2 [Arthrobacter sp. JUb115]